MKRLLLAFIIVLVLATNGWCPPAGDAVVTLTSSNITVQNVIARKTVTLTWTADSGDGSVTATTINAATYGIMGWYLYSAETNPGAGPPTPNYDIVINDTDALDLAGGLLMNRHTTTTEKVNIALGTGAQYPIIRGNLSFVLTNNTQVSAAGTCTLVFVAN